MSGRQNDHQEGDNYCTTFEQRVSRQAACRSSHSMFIKPSNERTTLLRFQDITNNTTKYDHSKTPTTEKMEESEASTPGPIHDDTMTDSSTEPTHPPPSTNDATPSPNRLIITKMELINFKSYAGTKTIGPFHKRFSSVVGPNGSGKSNVIDAMLFVFGKRAKKLRLNKVSELIHSSDGYTGDKELEYARVNVFFEEIADMEDSEDEYVTVPGTEVVISRIARRDNSSNYLMDGKNATFKKVAEYLGQKGIDLDNNRFLILQGEVEMISMMPPKGKGKDDDGLLEYLEDIIGSNKYVDETNAAAEKVEQLTEVRQEKLNRVKAAEKEVQALSGAKSEAMALVGKDREIRRKRNVLFQISQMMARKESESAREEKEGLVERLEGERSKLTDADERVKQIEDGMTAQRAEYDEIYDELTKTKEGYTKFERQDIQMKENIKFEKTNVKKLEEKLVAETKKGEDAEVALAEAQDSISALEERIEECAAAKEEEDAKLEAIFEETKSITEQLRKELEVKTQQLAPLLQERSVYQNSLDTAQMEVSLLEDSVSRAKEQLDKAERELASLDARQVQKREEMKSCKKELEEGRKRVEQAEGEAKELELREGALAKKSSELLVSVFCLSLLCQSICRRLLTLTQYRFDAILHAPSIVSTRPKQKSPKPPSNPPRDTPAQSPPYSKPQKRMESLPIVESLGA